MRILATFPGRAGDLLWALPTVRAVSQHFQTTVALKIAGEFAPMIPLLSQQAYLTDVVADPRWGMTGAPPPPSPSDGAWDRVYHLAYRGWPDHPLPKETEACLHQQWRDADGPVPVIDLETPWITTPPSPWMTTPLSLAIAGWSDCWFELKLGLMELLAARKHYLDVLCPQGSRWASEAGWDPTPWELAALHISIRKVFLGDCSALHVLAVALGKPVVLMEPMEARHNPIFYPLGKTGRVHLVTGNDGLPTFDARHVADVLEEALRATR